MHFQFVFLFQDFLHDIALSETHSTAYTDCSTTSGYLSLNPYVLRFLNQTPGDIYGNSGEHNLPLYFINLLFVERYDYDASHAFEYSTYPVSR
jgi:beta-mannosidase